MAKGAGIMEGIPMLILSVGGIILMLFFMTYSSQRHNLNSIKDKTVGNGQHGTARWATQQEIKRIYHHVPFTPELWRQAARAGREPTANGKPLPQGIILGSKGMKTTTALVDSDDVHVMMIGASGVGKTAYFLYPNLEYACASGMSFLALDTKGDLARNYGAIARDIYGYRISVVDLREPTRSDGNNLLTLINRYMDKHREDPKDIGAKAKAEKYAKILAKTIINPEGDGTDRGQNAYFYDAAEGLLASVVLLLAEFLPPEETGGYEMRHIASVFKLVQELLMQSSSRRGGNQFQELMSLLPADHKAKWLAGSALTASDQGMNSIMSTVLSKLNAFLDTELEQVICFDGSIDAELFVKEKCAIFLILPEEDATKNFVASLMIQNLARELFSVANEHGGKLPNRAVFFCDELGTMPPFDILPLFSAGRSRRLTLVPIIQSLAQLEKNYGKEGNSIGYVDASKLVEAGKMDQATFDNNFTAENGYTEGVPVFYVKGTGLFLFKALDNLLNDSAYTYQMTIKGYAVNNSYVLLFTHGNWQQIGQFGDTSTGKVVNETFTFDAIGSSSMGINGINNIEMYIFSIEVVRIAKRLLRL